MRVLVTGVSGFVGSHLAAALVGAGHSVRGLSRRLPTGSRRVDAVDYVDSVDIGDRSTLSPQMFAEIDTVVHLVGIIREARGGQTFERVQVDGTRNVVDCARAAGVPGPIVYMSAIGSAADAPARYSRTKFDAEQIVRNSGLPWAVLRPSIVLGKDGEFREQMEDLIRHGGLSAPIPFPVVPVPGSGKTVFQPIFIDDLGACVVRLLADPELWGQVYELGGATRVTFDEILSGFARALGVRKPLLHVPIPALGVAAAVMEKVLPKPPVTRDQLANLGRDNVPAANAAVETFGLRPVGFEQIVELIYRP